MSTKTRDRVFLAVGVIVLVVVVSVLTGLYLVVNAASDTALRWWSAIATLAVPMTALAGYGLGRLVARERTAGLETGITAVMGAANKTADLRVSTARQMRSKPPTPSYPQANLNVLLPGGAGQPVILPRTAQQNNVVEI